LTEAEARKRWCPFARVAVDTVVTDDPVPANRALDLHNNMPTWPAQCACMASFCMAWRWEHRFLGEHAANSTGYCGLAEGGAA
jgi:hypothetical protein